MARWSSQFNYEGLDLLIDEVRKTNVLEESPVDQLIPTTHPGRKPGSVGHCGRVRAPLQLDLSQYYSRRASCTNDLIK
jgi:hypothetical protein